MAGARHWDNVYRTKATDQVSWFQPHAESSLRLIKGLCPDREARIIDVGAGASVLVDDLLAAGYRNLSVLDIAASALAIAKARLGARAETVGWLVGDVTRVDLPAAAYDVWHDRAVFHFLTDANDRRRYVERVLRAVRPGGYVIVATFGPNGPEQCSNLDVCRYAPEALHGEFGKPFELVGHHTEPHLTPAGKTQEFVYCYCRRRG
ncbi:class I SAM-dependent methyltransferase [Parasulfuritortus cantonensis]|uniref:Class I SAM-dependent methyltransferase n=1 Tax=Parasulfuritortus cantonensis TaxID=2528202 RepID=A0A4R1B2F2_9PROT|nr:class I SAM-dependent methyltransferase [Parasulfuritortus cantonensis]TCJ12224.1 class I SAM-dependent methyltransferase [Parasulfuritortus cantonensis]